MSRGSKGTGHGDDLKHPRADLRDALRVGAPRLRSSGGGRRETNRRARTPAPVLLADATETRGVFPGPQPAPLAALKH